MKKFSATPATNHPRCSALQKHGVPLGVIALILLIAACHSGDDSWAQVQERGVLRVGLDPTYPPFEVTGESGLQGLDIDLANALAADMGVQTEFVLFGYDGLYDALATEQVDVLISALVIVPEKTRDFAYSEPYFNAGEILVIPATVDDDVEMADMNGRILAVELGALGHVEATTWADKLPELTVQPYPTADEAMTAVQEGEANAALVDAISGRLFLKDNPDLQPATKPVTAEPFAMVVRIADQQLLNELNNSLAQLQTSGKLNEIISQWLGE